MKHIVMVMVDTDTEPHRVKVDNRILGTTLNPEAAKAEIIKRDIDTLATGLITAIRQGGEWGVLNKAKTMNNLIDYFRKNISMIDLSQPTGTGIVEGKMDIVR
jgi:hypothetical protein